MDYEFEIKDYNSLKFYGKIKFKSLDQIKEFLELNKLTSIAWIDFRNNIMWVTNYGGFSQR